ncbi:MAG: cytochrome c maturation protein CcmE [Pelosinus sp.]|nr:cytochrome c maturation protein CcmE [Pelosinus sp.]
MKKHHFIGFGLIAVFFLFSAFSFKDSLTPYVTFSEAKSINGFVQVKGVLVSGSITQGEGSLKFTLRDERGEEKVIDYHGATPEGLEQSTSIVAVGKLKNGQFTAEKLLLKCPSKYQGTGSVNK